MGLKITAVGRLVKDAESKTVGSNQVVEFRFAADEGFGDKKVTNWLNCSWWGTRGTKMLDFLKKGSAFVVYGSLKLRPFTDKDGHERLSPDVEVTDVDFAGSKGDNADKGDAPQGQTPAAAKKPGNAPAPADADEMPF